MTAGPRFFPIQQVYVWRLPADARRFLYTANEMHSENSAMESPPVLALPPLCGARHLADSIPEGKMCLCLRFPARWIM